MTKEKTKKRKSRKVLVIVIVIFVALAVSVPFIYNAVKVHIIQTKVEKVMSGIKNGADNENIDKILKTVDKELKKTNHKNIAELFDFAVTRNEDYTKDFYRALVKNMSYKVGKPKRVSSDNYSVEIEIKNVDLRDNLTTIATNVGVNKVARLILGEKHVDPLSIPQSVEKVSDNLCKKGDFLHNKYTINVVKKKDKWKLKTNDLYSSMLLNCFGLLKSDKENSKSD